jgi:hypothetical protein
VIATNVGGLGEQLAGETLAILCEPDAASLAEGLRRALARPPVAAEAADAVGPQAAWRELGLLLVEQMRPLLRPAARPAPAGRAPGPSPGRAAPRLSD